MRTRITIVAALVVLVMLAAAPVPTAQLEPGVETSFTATAYCNSGVTKSGVRTREGIVAGDPDLLPVGSVLRIVEAGDGR